MNDVGIDAVCHGNLGDRCTGLGALGYHLAFVAELYRRRVSAFSLVIVST